MSRPDADRLLPCRPSGHGGCADAVGSAGSGGPMIVVRMARLVMVRWRESERPRDEQSVIEARSEY